MSAVIEVRDWTMDDVEHIIEIRGIYDGWSVARLKDGRLVNRWAGTEYTRRYEATEVTLANWRREEEEARA